MRVFCAIELPTDVRARVIDHISKLREASSKGSASWARDEALHLTLKFLGEIESQSAAALSRAA